MNSSVISDCPFREQPKVFQVILNIDTDDAPQISPLQIKRNLQGISPTNRVLLLHISQGKSNPRLPILNRDFKMNAEVFLW